MLHWKPYESVSRTFSFSLESYGSLFIFEGEWPETEDSDQNRNLNAEGKSETGRTEKQDSSPIVYIMGRPGLLAGKLQEGG